LATEVVMPQMGLTQTEGTLLRWYKAEGEPVAAGEALCEIETDKATVDVEAPAGGVLGQRLLLEGGTAPIGQQIAWIVAPGETAPRPSTGTPPASSPAARRLARELHIDLTRVQPTGPGGRIQEEDVRRAADGAEEARPTRTGGRRIELNRVRQTAARRLSESFRTVPHFYLRVVVDATELVRCKQQLRSQVVTYSDLIVQASARALAKHPEINARWDEDAIWQFDHVDIGLAVHTDRGLLVPVLRNPAAPPIEELAGLRQRLVSRALNGDIGPDDLEGATFTITNLGMHRIDSAWPVINPPQAAILAVGSIAPRVIPINNSPEVRQTVELVLAVDHRVLDGVDAAAFLDGLRVELEQPCYTSEV
jgi:pyruvate dehydrogenase E2 component (dihydrolipoamide acetyltransferase)